MAHYILKVETQNAIFTINFCVLKKVKKMKMEGFWGSSEGATYWCLNNTQHATM